MKLLWCCLLAILIAGFSASAIAHNASIGSAKDKGPKPPSRAQDFTLSLLDAKGKYEKATASGKAQGLAEMLELARTRMEAMNADVETDPEGVLKAMLPTGIRAELPPEVTPYVEEEADESGEYEVLHVDYVDHVKDRYQFGLKTAKGKLSLLFPGEAPDLPSGTRVRARGVKIGTTLAVEGAGAVTVNVASIQAAAASPGVLGARRTLVILVNFSDTPTQPFTVTAAANVVFGNTSSFDYAASYQQTWLTGDVAGWYTIATKSTTCDYGSIASQARSAAQAAGWALSNYSHYVYAFPANACQWWGLGTIGGSPSQAWVNTRWGFTQSVVAHEMGHNFGLYHSHSIDCGTVPIASGGCAVADYGDVFDTMGQATGNGHFNPFQKERLGWLDAGISPPITTVVAQPGTVQYTIGAYEAPRDGIPRALKIPTSTACTSSAKWYYVEARQGGGGIIVRQATVGSPDSSYLLDMTPTTNAWTDAGLLAGQSFTDPASGVTIAPVSYGSSGATINVTFPASGCTHSVPKVALTPTGTVFTLPGVSNTYTATITNTDGCGCAASAFDVAATVPSGWAATATRTDSIAAGASTTASVTITAGATAAGGYYDIAVNAANAAAPAVSGTATSTLAITGALAVSVKPNATSYNRPTGNKTTKATLTATVTSIGTQVQGIVVTVDVRNPAGGVTTLTGTTARNGTAKVSYVIDGGSPLGSYAVTSTATVGSTSGSGTTSFIVK